MNVPINAKKLRAALPQVVERVRKGTRFTVIYRSLPAFQITTDRHFHQVGLEVRPALRTHRARKPRRS